MMNCEKVTTWFHTDTLSPNINKSFYLGGVVLFAAYWIGIPMLRGKWLAWCCFLHTGLDLQCWEESDCRGVVCCILDWTNHSERKVVGVVLFAAYWSGLTMLRGKWLSWCCLLHTGLDLPCWEERDCRGVVCCILDWIYHADRKVVGVVLSAAYWIGLRSLPCWEESDCRGVVCCILDWTYHAERKVVAVLLFAAYWIGLTMLRVKWLSWYCLLHTGLDSPCWEESDCRGVVCCILDCTYHAERKVVGVVLFAALWIWFTMLRGKWLAAWCCLLHTGLYLPCWEERYPCSCSCCPLRGTCLEWGCDRNGTRQLRNCWRYP